MASLSFFVGIIGNNFISFFFPLIISYMCKAPFVEILFIIFDGYFISNDFMQAM